jgi:hypothetical protein
MSYPLFTAIFLDDESKRATKRIFDAISETGEYDHIYCTHVTLTQRPDFSEIVNSESEPWAECYLTRLIQDPYIQTFEVFVPFPCKKRLTHLTYAIADDEDHAKFVNKYGGNKRPIAKPYYSNHLLKHVKDVERGREQALNTSINNRITVTPFTPLKIKGIISTIRGASPRFSGMGPARRS